MKNETKSTPATAHEVNKAIVKNAFDSFSMSFCDIRMSVKYHEIRDLLEKIDLDLYKLFETMCFNAEYNDDMRLYCGIIQHFYDKLENLINIEDSKANIKMSKKSGNLAPYFRISENAYDVDMEEFTKCLEIYYL